MSSGVQFDEVFMKKATEILCWKILEFAGPATPFGFVPLESGREMELNTKYD